MKFKEFYYYDFSQLELYEIPTDIIFEGEINASNLISNTDPERGRKGIYDVTVLNNKPGLTPNGQWISYKVRANPSVQGKNHFGYIKFNDSNKKIHEVYCSCLDFQFRLYYPFVEKGLAKWDVDPAFKRHTIDAYGRNFSHDKTNGYGINNADPNHLYVCKHLYNVIRSYVLGAMKSSRVPEEKVPPEFKPPIKLEPKVTTKVEPEELSQEISPEKEVPFGTPHKEFIPL